MSAFGILLPNFQAIFCHSSDRVPIAENGIEFRCRTVRVAALEGCASDTCCLTSLHFKLALL